MSDFACTIELPFNHKTKSYFQVDVTEDYEDDKFHVVVYEHHIGDGVFKGEEPAEHIDTQGFENMEAVYQYLKNLEGDAS